MCTLSWLSSAGGGYTAWFNRDELHTRGVEQMPESRESENGVSWIAPIDPDSGGTWLMVNAHGVMVGLLNDYTTKWSVSMGAPRESRGRLTPMTKDSVSAKEAVTLVGQQNLANTPPFEVVAFDSEGRVAGLHWDGATVRLSEGAAIRFPRSSSSYNPRLIIAERRRSFPMPVTDETLEEFHRAHDVERGAASVNMCRPDASTRSICRIHVTEKAVELLYDPQLWPGAPRCENERTEITIKRVNPTLRTSVGISN
jgi:hypothetical protein